MRTLLLITAALALSACQPPARDEAPPGGSGPAIEACNDVAPDMNRLVEVRESVAVAAAAADLRGGRIAPGVYDLTGATRIDRATGWQGGRAVAMSIVEEANGPLTFNWASAAVGGGEADRWTATFTDVAQQGQLTYTCGRMGEVLAGFAVSGDTLQLRIPDGANGALDLAFERRS